MKKFIFIFSCFIFIQCAPDRTILLITDTETQMLEKFEKMDSMNKVFITDENEPGEQLILCLTFINKDSKKVVSNQRISFYHTSTNGDYEPTNSNDETTARLNGTAVTNEFGEIYIKTILPGDYGSAENNRHIHTTVYDAHPEPYDIFFKQFSGGMGYFMNSGNDQMFFADVKKTTDNILVTFVTIDVKNPKIEE